MTIRRLPDNSFYSFCKDPSHNPPTHISLAPGTYEYTCPGCGVRQIFYVQETTLATEDTTIR